MQQEIIKSITTNFGIEIKEHLTREKLIEHLAYHINDLVNNDFQKLVFLLYKIDVNENKLNEALQNMHTDSPSIIAALIIDRELEKMESRKNNTKQSGYSEEEKW
jgi:hypothetical protein